MRFLGLVLVIGACAVRPQPIDLLQDAGGPFEPDRNLTIVLHDHSGNGHKLVAATYLLDGRAIFHRARGRGFTELPEDLRVFKTKAEPGSHTLLVLLEYQPSEYGLFTYTRSHYVKVTSGTDFVVQAGEPTAIHAVLSEQGGVTTRIEDRFHVQYFVTYPEVLARR